MSRRNIYNFLRNLSNNNSKDWMDAHRDEYHAAKDEWLKTVQQLLDRLDRHDSRFGQMNPKKCILRITNNRMFHPDKPVYRDNFGFSPSDKDTPGIYVHISPKESFVGGGVHRPDTGDLKKIRAAIDYDGGELKKIINQASFRAFYGGLSEDDQLLKTHPRTYYADHPHIDLLRRKNFTAIRTLTQKEVIGDDFVDLVERAYVEIIPMLDYFKRALKMEA